MLLIWEPPDAERKEFEFLPRKLTTADAEAIEMVGGDVWDNFDEFARLFNAGNRRALRAALWSMLRREQPLLRFESLSVGAYDITLDFGEAEKAVIRDLLLSGQEIDVEQRKVFVGWLGEDPLESGPKDD